MQGMGDATYARRTRHEREIRRDAGGMRSGLLPSSCAPYELARSIFEKQAATGDVSAMFQLGYLLMMGRGLASGLRRIAPLADDGR